MVPVKTSSKAASPADLELQPILTGQAPADRHLTRTAKTRALLRDPVTRAALGNLGLILTWYVLSLYTHASFPSAAAYTPVNLRYFFSTLLSLWNRKLVGEGHGVFGKGAFPGTSAAAL